MVGLTLTVLPFVLRVSDQHLQCIRTVLLKYDCATSAHRDTPHLFLDCRFNHQLDLRGGRDAMRQPCAQLVPLTLSRTFLRNTFTQKRMSSSPKHHAHKNGSSHLRPVTLHKHAARFCLVMSVDHRHSSRQRQTLPLVGVMGANVRFQKMFSEVTSQPNRLRLDRLTSVSIFYSGTPPCRVSTGTDNTQNNS